MPTKSAGRVSIRVLPDSSRFREDLKLSLERIEKTMKATIPAHLEVTRDSVRRLKEQLRDLQVRIKVEPYVTEQQLNDIKEKLEDIDPNIRVDLDALNAQRRLAFMARDRTVSLFVKVNQASVAAAMSTLAALSGARLVGNVFDSFFKNLKELDKNAPKIGAIATGITAIVGIAGAGVSNILGLAGSLAQLAQASILLPGFMIGAGVAIGVAVAALKDMKTVLKDLGPSFNALQDNISRHFWEQAEQPIRELVDALLPSLNEQLSNTAQALGGIFGDLSNSIRENVTPAYLDTVFDRMNRGLNRARAGIAPFIHALTTLGGFGSQYFERTGEAIAKLAKRFDDFISKANKSGELQEWADEGIQAFKDLGRVVANTFRVFAALNRAAQQAGGSTFAGLADGLGKLAKVLNTAEFQTTFATIFAGAHKAMDGLIDGLGELGHGLSSFAPTLAVAFSEVGLILEGVGRALRRLFENPQLQQGIQNFFSGFKTFIDTIGPGMEPLGRIIGTLATAMGSLLAQAGPLITQVLDVLAPLFEEIWKAVQPLIPDLITLASTVLKELSPVFLTLAREVLPELIPILADLIPIVADLVKAAAPVLVEFFKNLGAALEAAQPYIKSGAEWLHNMATALNEFPLAMFQFFATNKLDFFETMFGIAIDHPEIPAFFSALNVSLGGLFDKIAGAGTAVEQMGLFFESVQKVAGELGLGALAVAINGITALLPTWQIFWAGLTTAITAFQTSSTIVLTTALEALKRQFPIFASGSTPFWTSFWSGLAPIVTTYLTVANTRVGGGLGGIATTIGLWIAGNVPQWTRWMTLVQATVTTGMEAVSRASRSPLPGIIISFIGFFGDAGARFIEGFNALAGYAKVYMGRVVAGIQIGVAQAIQVVTGMPGQMTLALFNYVGDFFSAGSSLITAFVQGISSGTNPAISAAIAVVKAAMSVLPHSPAEKGPLSGQGWINLKKSGTAITRQFASGLDYDLRPVQNAMGRVAGAAQFNGGSVSTASVRSDAGGYADARDRSLITIEGDYYGATPEKVANEFDKKIRRTNLASQIGKIGIA